MKRKTASGAETPATRGNSWQGYVIIVVAVFFLAWQSPCAKTLQEHGVRSLDTVTMLFVVATVLANLVALLGGKAPQIYRKGLANWKVVLPVGLSNFGISMGMFMAVQTVSAGVISVILYLFPAFVCLFFLLTKMRPVSGLNKLAVLLSIAGCVLALNVIGTPPGEISFVGLGFAFVACLSYTAYSLLCDVAVPPELDKLSLVVNGLLVSTALSILVNPSMFLHFGELGAMDWGIFAFLALLTKFLCLLMIVRGVQSIGAEKASVVMSMEVPFTLLIARVTLGEVMLPVQLLGVALVVLAAILLQRQ